MANIYILGQSLNEVLLMDRQQDGRTDERADLKQRFTLSLTKTTTMGNFKAFQYRIIRDLFYVYVKKFEFHFLQLHIIKTNKLCFFMHNERVPGVAKQTR